MMIAWYSHNIKFGDKTDIPPVLFSQELYINVFTGVVYKWMIKHSSETILWQSYAKIFVFYFEKILN